MRDSACNQTARLVQYWSNKQSDCLDKHIIQVSSSVHPEQAAAGDVQSTRVRFVAGIYVRLCCFVTQLTDQTGRSGYMCPHSPAHVKMFLMLLPSNTRSAVYPQHTVFSDCNYLHYLQVSVRAILHFCNDPVSPGGLLKFHSVVCSNQKYSLLLFGVHTSQHHMDVHWGYSSVLKQTVSVWITLTKDLKTT